MIMAQTATNRFNISTKDLPYSKMVFPNAALDRFKYVVWSVLTPTWPLLRDTCTTLGMVTHEIRQPFRVGQLVLGKSIDELVAFLVSRGYGNHFVAWKDKGEILGLRKVENFFHQYHIRIFEDGEICGHYEFTPESYPILHLKGIGQEDRTAEFKELLKGWIV